MDSLNRGLAPFPADVWKMIDDAAVGAARDRRHRRARRHVRSKLITGMTGRLGQADDSAEFGASSGGVSLRSAMCVHPVLRKSRKLA
jgi:hypothetical protein